MDEIGERANGPESASIRQGIFILKNVSRTPAALLTLVLGPTGLAADDLKVSIREWDVPTPNSRPHDPETAPDGSLLACSGVNKVAIAEVSGKS